MQTKRPHARSYQITLIDERDYSSLAQERARKLDKIEMLLSEGCSEETALLAVEISRSTYFRWKKQYKEFGIVGLESESRRPLSVRTHKWDERLVKAILNLRKKYPAWGKQKITVLLRSEMGMTASVGTVGRIISHLIKQGLIYSVQFYFGHKRGKPRVFNNHAQRWRSHMRAKEPGEMVQIDQMTVFMPRDKPIKSFRAVCPITRFTVEQAYYTASSINAADFLDYVRKKLPFPLQSIQVDGGSEFMGEFEQKCKNYAIPLYVLPPRSPELNGKVERANGTSKYEFYYQYEGPGGLSNLRPKLEKYIDSYNRKRPHQALRYLTPLQYLEKRGAFQSHMS